MTKTIVTPEGTITAREVELMSDDDVWCLVNEVADEFIDAVADRPEDQRAYWLAVAVHQWHDDHMLANPDPRVECKAGCSWCCYTRVVLHQGEAEILAAPIKQLPRPARRKMVREIKERYDKVAHLSDPDHWVAKVPCVFLDQITGKCKVYPLRPFNCRKWHSVSVADCRDGWGQRDSTSPQSMFLMQISGLAVAAWHKALAHYGLAKPGETAEEIDRAITKEELHTALLRVLEG